MGQKLTMIPGTKGVNNRIHWSTNFYFFSLADHLGVFSGVLKVADFEYNIGFARLALV